MYSVNFHVLLYIERPVIFIYETRNLWKEPDGGNTG